MAPKDEEIDDRKSQAGRSAKIFCMILLFVLIYGRMIFSSFNEDSGFSQKTSANMTDITIYGQIDGKYFNDHVLKEAKEMVRQIFEQDHIRIFNSTGVKQGLTEARKSPKAPEIKGKQMSYNLRRKNNKKSNQKQIVYVKNKD